MKKRARLVLMTAILLMIGMHSTIGRAQEQRYKTFLPAVLYTRPPVNRPPDTSSETVFNAPYFQTSDVVGSKFGEMGIFWFGKVDPSTNYTDVRIGYNDEALWVYTASFDRRLWYNTSSNGSDLDQWDAVTLLLHTSSGVQSQNPDQASYRFTGGFYSYAGSSIYKAAYRGDGSTWAKVTIPFSHTPGWRGIAVNDDADDKGWVNTFKIPFASLGLSGRPADGAVWRMSLILHDRDSRPGPPQVNQVWPNGTQRDDPGSWGKLRFGLPAFTPPAISNARTTTIRHKLNGAVVPDAAVGGGATCGAGMEYWTQWGEAKYAGKDDFNIQNQSDVSDWPCFSKYYVTFPMNAVPAGKTIRSARLVLHEFGGSDPTGALPSMIQALEASGDWSEATITWNNGPQAVENVAQSWVRVFGANRSVVWPGDPYGWDVSRAAARAHANGRPLRLVLYSADSAYHSGKYFVSSDTGDWNAEGRPTLIVEWGDSN